MWMRNTANTNSGRTAGRSGRKLLAAVLAGAAFAWACLTAPAAMAYDQISPPSGYGVSSNYANSQDALMYPCFGALIYPGVRHCRPAANLGCCNTGWRTPIANNVYIDCDRDNYQEIMYKIRRVRTNGALYFKGRHCRVSLNVNSSLRIIGLPSPSHDYPILEALEGQSCLRVGPRAEKVSISHITFLSSRGQTSACIDSSARELSFVDSNLRYDGEEPAIKIDGGRFNLSNSNVVARTLTSAIEINRAGFYAENSRIASTYNGIKGNIENDSRIIGLTFMQLGDWQGFTRGEGAKAVDLKLLTSGSVLTADQIKVLFYGNGLYLSGAGEALVSNSLFYSDHAITSGLDRVRILNNYIFADEIGIDISDGQAFVGDNHIQLVRTAGIATAKEAKLRAVNNHIMTMNCEGLRDGSRVLSERSCTPWYKDATFGIPGGGVDWSLNVVLEDGCLQPPSDPRAADLCTRYRSGSKLLSPAPEAGEASSFSNLMERGCQTSKSPNSPLAIQCRSFAEDTRLMQIRQKAFDDKKLEQADLDTAKSDYQRRSMESLKSLCRTDMGVSEQWKTSVCDSFDKSYAQLKKPYEDDETNRDLTGGKEWLMRLLYDNNENNTLYSLSSTSFMPLFDKYRPRYMQTSATDTCTSKSDTECKVTNKTGYFVP
jgi:hypothetical protein